MSSESLLSVSVSICGSLSSAGVECVSVLSFSSSAVSSSFVGASGVLESEFLSSSDSSACLVSRELSFSARSSEVLLSLASEFLLFSGSITWLVPGELSFIAECAEVVLSFLGGSD